MESNMDQDILNMEGVGSKRVGRVEEDSTHATNCLLVISRSTLKSSFSGSP